ncbi:Gfo/Idh/MocA family protein [uncultured Amnibacterium sp.]|uniref:Gfo/Idh/MocA family protein n=1 Tax=uncultured Amnibacterium sp. TaxID=1631851 RepID=UPI0035C9478E
MRVAVMSFAHVHAASYIGHLLGACDIEVLTCDPGGIAAEGELPRGVEFAKQLGAAYVDSYEELFAWRPHAVVICTENSRHVDAVRLAVRAGAHVLCEKPLATSTADAEEIVRLCDDAGVLLMTAFPIRFTQAFAELTARIAAGEVGDVLGVLGTNNGKIPTGDRRWFTQSIWSGGGALVDHVVHCADLLDVLLGEAPVSVRAVSNGVLHGDLDLEVETGGLVTLRYPSGVFATIDCSWSQPLNAAVWGDVELQVTGTRGSLSMRAMSRYVGGTLADGPAWVPFGLDFDGAMIDHFLHSVRTGSRPAPDGAVGLRTTQIVEAARLSAGTGAVVELRQG